MVGARALLVWDGGSKVAIPPRMGMPCEDQMVGTTGEKLIEVGTRLCYDSLGYGPDGERKGRSTENTLKNVMDVYHGSVLEHAVRTVEFKPRDREVVLMAFNNRPGCWLRTKLDETAHPHAATCFFRLTMNARAVVEWDQWSEILRVEHGFPAHSGMVAAWAGLGERLREMWSREAPLIVKHEPKGGTWPVWLITTPMNFVEPETDAEKHISLYLVGSRGFSHEQVRHRFAMSQRSTRFCDESASPWHLHPLIEAFIKANPAMESLFGAMLSSAETNSKAVYDRICDALQDWLVKTLPPDTPYLKKHARKQARGAARGFLGNALETQMLYTAPVWGWRHILTMRAADSADAEIRNIITEALPELQRSRYGDRFADFKLQPASDGMGMSLAGGGHK